MTRNVGAAEWAMLGVLSLLWGGSFLFNEIALDGLGPQTVVAGRVALAALVLLAYARLRGRALPKEPRIWGGLFLLGLFNNIVPFSLILWGQTQIEGGLASILNAATPLFTVLIAPLMTRDEGLSAGRVAGVSIGFAGVALLIGPEALRHFGPTELGQIAVLGAAVSYAWSGLFGRRFSGMAPEVTAGGMLLCSSVVAVPLALVLERPWSFAPDSGALAATVALAVLSSGVAYVVFFRVLARAGATFATSSTFLIPISALALGAIFRGERIDALDFVGMAVIFVGLATLDGRVFGLLRRFALGPARWPSAAQDAPRASEAASNRGNSLDATSAPLN